MNEDNNGDVTGVIKAAPQEDHENKKNKKLKKYKEGAERMLSLLSPR